MDFTYRLVCCPSFFNSILKISKADHRISTYCASGLDIEHIYMGGYDARVGTILLRACVYDEPDYLLGVFD
jgi:hypothetical protein